MLNLPIGVEPAHYPRSKRGALPLSYGRTNLLSLYGSVTVDLRGAPFTAPSPCPGTSSRATSHANSPAGTLVPPPIARTPAAGSRHSAREQDAPACRPPVCLMVGAPGYDPGRLQQSAAPVYKTEPHDSADAVQRICARYLLNRARKMVGVAGFEPATSSFRTKSASRLRYTPEVARHGR
jgi:hypothetical protein